MTPGISADRLTARGARTTIAVFERYGDAEQAVDTLADRRFPVDRVSIVARDLRMVEQVTGRMTTARSALNTALTGAALGVVLGFIFGLFNWVDPVISGLALALWGLLVGAIAGAVLGAVAHWATAGRRDFDSVQRLQARAYEVTVDAELAEDAQRVLNSDGNAA